MERDCDECDWVEVTCLSSARVEYLPARRCAEHALVDTSQLATTYDRDPLLPMPMRPPGTGLGMFLVEYDPGYLGLGASLWHRDWPMSRSYRPLFVNLMMSLSWILGALIVVLPALVVACVARLAMPTRTETQESPPLLGMSQERRGFVNGV